MNFDVKKIWKHFEKNKILKSVDEKKSCENFRFFRDFSIKNEKYEILEFWKCRLFGVEKIMIFDQKVDFSSSIFQWFFNDSCVFCDFPKKFRHFSKTFFWVDDFKWT